MLRHLSKTFGSAMAALCLVSTLAMAQSQSSTPPIPQGQNPTVYQERVHNPAPAQPLPPPQTMTCTQDDRMGNCTAAVGPDGKDRVVVGEGLKRGDVMTCVDRGSVVDCQPTKS
jgi:hypothetical protein